MTGFNNEDSSKEIYFICIGEQQWGLSTGRTITYPISLLVLYSIVALDAASGMDAVQVCDVNTADNTNAIIFQMRLTQGDILPDNMTGFYWILIGRVQQWGTEPGVGTYEYPIPYTSLCYGVITNRQVRKSNNVTTAVDITLTEFTCSKTDTMGDYTFNWLSAGV